MTSSSVSPGAIPFVCDYVDISVCRSLGNVLPVRLCHGRDPALDFTEPQRRRNIGPAKMFGGVYVTYRERSVRSRLASADLIGYSVVFQIASDASGVRLYSSITKIGFCVFG
jgi:hypothetical protein